MATNVYGSSDDLIKFTGDISGEINCCVTEEYNPVGVIFSDGTLLKVWYGKEEHGGVWGIKVVQKGTLFDCLVICTDEDADPYSDVANFKPGLKWAYECRGLSMVE